MNRKISVVLGIAGCVIAAAGCNQSDTSGLDRADRLTNLQRTQFGFDEEDGQSKAVKTSTVRLPSDHPKDVPIYPRGTITMAFGKSTRTIQLETGDSADQIMSFYRRELAKHGWRISGNAAGNIQARKGKRIVNVSTQARRDPKPNDSQLVAIQVAGV